MIADDRAAGPVSFNAVDTSADLGGLIRFLDAANGTAGLTAAKRALLTQLDLGRARAALDVGCGPGIDIAQMARLMPDDAHVSGIDISETMIAEARKRTAGLGPQVLLRTGDAADLPYSDQAFDVCRVATVLQHVPDPARVIQEMARVTRPGGRIGVLEFDQETVFVDHPDTKTTQIILDTLASAMVQGRIGRQTPRLLRAAGLTDVTVTPWVNLGSPQFFRAILHDHLARLADEGILSSERSGQWWAELDAWAQAGDFLGGGVFFAAAASRPR